MSCSWADRGRPMPRGCVCEREVCWFGTSAWSLALRWTIAVHITMESPSDTFPPNNCSNVPIAPKSAPVLCKHWFGKKTVERNWPTWGDKCVHWLWILEQFGLSVLKPFTWSPMLNDEGDSTWRCGTVRLKAWTLVRCQRKFKEIFKENTSDGSISDRAQSYQREATHVWIALLACRRALMFDRVAASHPFTCN
jgi:hypothetical protein